MIEKTILEYLRKELPKDIAVSVIRTGIKENEFVVFEKLSSRETNHIKSSSFAFQSYSDTLYGAIKINELVKEKLKNINTVSSIASVRFETDYNFTDTTTKKYRYQCIFEFVYY